MKTKRLKKALTEIKDKLCLDYALNQGFMSPTCTMKKIDDLYDENAIGIYIRYFLQFVTFKVISIFFMSSSTDFVSYENLINIA